MKGNFKIAHIIYLALTLGVLGSFAYTQHRGLRLLNVFTGGLQSKVGTYGPDHK